ncbi:MAG: hypothetical protein HRT72_00070 [Flavobacteriales bacterium]|nr:hypothetical protein [Flavobacteriales bacterium]
MAYAGFAIDFIAASTMHYLQGDAEFYAPLVVLAMAVALSTTERCM